MENLHNTVKYARQQTYLLWTYHEPFCYSIWGSSCFARIDMLTWLPEMSSSIKDWKNLLNSPHVMIPISNFVCSDEFWINDILVLRIRPAVHDFSPRLDLVSPILSHHWHQTALIYTKWYCFEWLLFNC